YDARLDASFTQHRVDQRSLVFAVAETAADDVRNAVGHEAVDAELESYVTGVSDHPIVDPRNLGSGVGRASDELTHRAAQALVRVELVRDESPIPAADLLPSAVGGHVQVGHELGHAGHRRLGSERGDVLEPEAIDPASIRFAGVSDQAPH